ncbi:uncharacterized protein LOC117236133 isoform X1 [Bombus vosnesenskii]|uniref:Uncharacterized protein LOC117236133 isoform X1 n=1 Tax=Bombus vosnesenskii TaxID=207650 RepID=A0A6J3KS77_9HYME|nr:uncharacterized protein LOC117236133 isoform X1 [Bombus vosnesenskii]XP_033354714.1 uncharacterized protein LOC117236133 isoform X1 [Bombus vosnesenskii]XP_033354715.1 uncharacterized protein LOC117236133 isoform X1 [Bombus vosnesenskii]
MNNKKDDEDAKLDGCLKLNICSRKRNMFEEYSKIFRILLASWKENYGQLRNDEFNENLEDLILPSNEDWRYRVYYRLVELQRECDVDFVKRRVEETGLGTEVETKLEAERNRKKNDWEWEPKKHGHSLTMVKPRKYGSEESKGGSLMSVDRISGSMIESCVQPGWRVNDILLAAKVLRKVQPSPMYSDEAEMRRVFGLVYDVLRYKKIFVRALEDIGFWQHNNAIKDREKIVWLLLYDLQGRKFAKPQFETVNFEEREKIFEAAGLADVENALLNVKTRLAASISRLRIRGSALNLDELLPSRLRVIEGVAWGVQARIASGWINSMKIVNKIEFLEEMSKLKLTYCESKGAKVELEENEYAFDPICPKMVHLHESMREMLAVSSIVRDHRFVFLERSLCIGAAALVQAIRVGRVYGPVILTHSLAPRHTGYLAGLLADIEHAGKLLAFGAGDRRCEYETYLKNLGITLQRCRVFSEKYASHLTTSESERATVVLAVPSCTYTGVRDIVDLAVARGGDVDLLESLTDGHTNSLHDDIDDNYERQDNNCEDEKNYNDHEQWRTFLTDQMSTLKYTLTRPNVQFVVYEVHTILPSETTEMVRQVVDCVNRMAMEKYIREHPRKAPKESSKLVKMDEELRKDDHTSTLSANITIPDSDLFEVSSIDDIYGENVSDMLNPGCFLVVIKRKEMVQFDSLFMIKVAESKGLFGDPKVQQRSKQESIIDQSIRQSLQTGAQKRAKRVKVEIERIMAHTYSSLSKSVQENQICPRHKRCASWEEATGLQVFENAKLDVKTWRKQKNSANPSNTPLYATSSRKKELEAIRSIFSPQSEFKASTLHTEPKQKRSSSTLTNSLNIESLPREEWSHATSSILRSPIVARAARLIRLEDSIDSENYEEAKKQTRSKTGHRYWASRKTSRLLHPVGSPSNVYSSLFDIV